MKISLLYFTLVTARVCDYPNYSQKNIQDPFQDSLKYTEQIALLKPSQCYSSHN